MIGKTYLSLSLLHLVLLLFTKLHKLKLQEVTVSVVLFQGVTNHMKITCNIPVGKMRIVVAMIATKVSWLCKEVAYNTILTNSTTSRDDRQS